MREKNLIWLDMEMSGLDPHVCYPLEIATVVTDEALEVLAEGPSLVIHQPDEVLAAMDEWNTTHHTANGLVEAVRSSTVSCAEAGRLTLEFMRRWTEPETSPLCGNSVARDRRFLRLHLPEVHAHFHYRMIDVSTIKELAVRWYDLEPPAKRTNHRALDDVLESIAELRHYRARVFRAS